MSEAVRIITEHVRMRVRREGVDLASDNALAEQYVRDELQCCSQRALGGSLAPSTPPPLRLRPRGAVGRPRSQARSSTP